MSQENPIQIRVNVKETMARGEGAFKRVLSAETDSPTCTILSVNEEQADQNSPKRRPVIRAIFTGDVQTDNLSVTVGKNEAKIALSTVDGVTAISIMGLNNVPQQSWYEGDVEAETDQTWRAHRRLQTLNNNRSKKQQVPLSWEERKRTKSALLALPLKDIARLEATKSLGENNVALLEAQGLKDVWDNVLLELNQKIVGQGFSQDQCSRLIEMIQYPLSHWFLSIYHINKQVKHSALPAWIDQILSNPELKTIL